MGRLTESQADALVSTLTGAARTAAVSARSADPDVWHPAEGLESPEPSLESDAHRIRAIAHEPGRLDELGRSLTLDLAAYLRRPVRCSMAPGGATIANAWRFGAPIRGGGVWMDVDIGLAAAFGDAMIGGDGTAPIGRGRRVRALAAVVVRRMLLAVTSAARVDIGDVVSLASAAEHGSPIAGGLCAVAVEGYPFSLGVFANTPVRDKQIDGPVVPPERSPVEAAPAMRPGDQEAALRTAVDAFNARLAELTQSRVTARSVTIEKIDGSEVAGPPASSLGLALTAGGNGAVVAFVDAATVSAIAGAAACAPLAANESPGEVVVAATEAVVRDALERASLELPALGGEGHRVVRLSDDPLTARTPHHAVDVEVSIDGRASTLRLLVPSWMLADRGKRGA